MTTSVDIHSIKSTKVRFVEHTARNSHNFTTLSVSGLSMKDELTEVTFYFHKSVDPSLVTDIDLSSYRANSIDGAETMACSVYELHQESLDLLIQATKQLDLFAAVQAYRASSSSNPSGFNQSLESIDALRLNISAHRERTQRIIAEMVIPDDPNTP